MHESKEMSKKGVKPTLILVSHPCSLMAKKTSGAVCCTALSANCFLCCWTEWGKSEYRSNSNQQLEGKVSWIESNQDRWNLHCP